MSLVSSKVFGPWEAQARRLETFFLRPNGDTWIEACRDFVFVPGSSQIIGRKLVQVIGFSHVEDVTLAGVNLLDRSVNAMYEKPFVYETQATGALYGWFTIRGGGETERWTLCDPKVYIPARQVEGADGKPVSIGGSYGTLADGGVCSGGLAAALAREDLDEAIDV